MNEKIHDNAFNWYDSHVLLTEEVVYRKCAVCDSDDVVIMLRAKNSFAFYLCEDCSNKGLRPIHPHQSDDHISQA
jgi:hypothetical protein